MNKVDRYKEFVVNNIYNKCEYRVFNMVSGVDAEPITSLHCVFPFATTQYSYDLNKLRNLRNLDGCWMSFSVGFKKYVSETYGIHILESKEIFDGMMDKLLGYE
jgi:hypothetical protein